jgi:hypothetical protein
MHAKREVGSAPLSYWTTDERIDLRGAFDWAAARELYQDEEYAAANQAVDIICGQQGMRPSDLCLEEGGRWASWPVTSAAELFREGASDQIEDNQLPDHAPPAFAGDRPVSLWADAPDDNHRATALAFHAAERGEYYTLRAIRWYLDEYDSACLLELARDNVHTLTDAGLHDHYEGLIRGYVREHGDDPANVDSADHRPVYF